MNTNPTSTVTEDIPFASTTPDPTSFPRGSRPPHLNFTTMPIEPAVVRLRESGRIIIRALLQTSTLPHFGVAMPNTVLPELTWRQRVRRWGQRGRDLPNTVRNRVARLRDSLMRRPVPAAERANVGVQRAVKTILVGQLREEWWQVVGERAWGDLEFQREISEAIVMQLREEVLWLPHGWKPIAVSPHFFWLTLALIAAEGNGPQPWWRRAWRWVRRRWQKREQLAIFGDKADFIHQIQHYCDTPEWMGFWEQWLLARCMPAQIRLVYGLEARLHNAIFALPYLRDVVTHPVTNDIEKAGTLLLARVDWREGQPTWLDS